VEEWKKSTAEYKQSSIPLGRFDFGAAPAATTAPPMGQSNSQPNPPSSNPLRATTPATTPSSHTRQQSAGGRQVSSHYETSGSRVLKPSYPPVLTSQSTPALGVSSTRSSASTAMDGQRSHSSNGRSRHSGEDPQGKYDLVTQASVESFHFEENAFWFHVRASFASGASLVLYRLYEDFYDFQIALMDEFPVEAGRRPAQPGGEARRIIPKMPGPVKEVNEVICASRVGDLGEYLKQLCLLPRYMLQHRLFYDFLSPRPGDVEVTLPISTSGTTSYDEQENGGEEDVEYLHRMPNGNSAAAGDSLAREMGAANLTDDDQSSRASSMQRDSGSGTGARYSSRSGSLPFSTTTAAAAASSRQQADVSPPTSSPPQGSTFGIRTAERSSSSTPNAGPASATLAGAGAGAGGATNQPPFVKIKIFHRNTDDLIALRVPPTVSRVSLLEKVRDRLGGDVSKLRYREETPGSGSGATAAAAANARFVEVANDAELDRWIRGGSRLVLYAD
jgi:bud emergence protein 1